MENTEKYKVEQQEKYQAAKKRVEDLKGFYTHAIIFVLVMSGLALADYYDDKPWWVHWVLLGWGAGVIVHAVKIYAPNMNSSKSWSQDWEEKKIRELMDD